MLSRYASRAPRKWLNLSYSSPVTLQMNRTRITLIRSMSTIYNDHLPSSGAGGFELTFLGTGSQGGARRYPSCLALRVRGASSSEVWLFDAGEGATAQLQRSNMRMSLVRNIFITHLHGDHLYGLPGLVLSVLGGKDLGNGTNCTEPTLNIYGPPGVRAFLRIALGVASFRPSFKNALCINELQWPSDFGPSGQKFRHRCASAYWKNPVKKLGFEAPGRDIEPERCEKTGAYTYHLSEEVDDEEDSTQRSPELDRKLRIRRGPALVTAAPILHTVPTFAYEVSETVVSKRFSKKKLKELGIPTDGRGEVRKLFHAWLSGKSGVWNGKDISGDDVMESGRPPRRICVVGDTYDAEGAAHIANDVDVLVHEATNMAVQTKTAKSRGHSSTLGATSFAKRVNAKRLILNHTSVSYSEKKIRAMEAEARSMFGADKVFVAKDLSVFNVPTAEEDSEHFLFRRFAGFADSIEYKDNSQGIIPCDFVVDPEMKPYNNDTDDDDFTLDEYDMNVMYEEGDEKDHKCSNENGKHIMDRNGILRRSPMMKSLKPLPGLKSLAQITDTQKPLLRRWSPPRHDPVPSIGSKTRVARRMGMFSAPGR